MHSSAVVVTLWCVFMCVSSLGVLFVRPRPCRERMAPRARGGQSVRNRDVEGHVVEDHMLTTTLRTTVLARFGCTVERWVYIGMARVRILLALVFCFTELQTAGQQLHRAIGEGSPPSPPF